MECSKETVDVINLVLSIFVYKLTDKYIDIEDKISFQKIFLDLIKKWHTNKFIKNIQILIILKSKDPFIISYKVVVFFFICQKKTKYEHLVKLESHLILIFIFFNEIRWYSENKFSPIVKLYLRFWDSIFFYVDSTIYYKYFATSARNNYSTCFTIACPYSFLRFWNLRPVKKYTH